ncbi:MAG: hypothetical protein IID40_08215 [Planctomycetes bacterium]|nr:hypothetical protein [Planctomycetota bacterium]
MKAYVVETNVAIVANNLPEKTPQANAVCILACIRKLRECLNILKAESEGRLVLDDAGRIQREYAAHLSRSGQPGVGDEFFFEVIQQEYGPCCERVSITAQGYSYEEFPSDPALAGFDPADHKFVAAALASENDPIVLNAVDSDWHNFAAALEAAGVRIDQLCPQCLKEDSGGGEQAR